MHAYSLYGRIWYQPNPRIQIYQLQVKSSIMNGYVHEKSFIVLFDVG